MTTAQSETEKPKAPPAPGSLNALDKRARLLLEHNQLLSDRASILVLWRDLNRYLYTSRGRFLTTDHLKGDRRSKDSLDITAILAARTCAAGIATGVTNAAREWFRLSTPDPDLAEFGAVKTWLHTVTERMRGVFLGSNFYKAMHVMYGDMAGYGTSPVLIEEDPRTVIRCYPFPVGSYCIGNDAQLRVNYFTREFQMSVRQLVERYGFENCSLTVQTAWRTGNLRGWYDVVHIIYPNPDYDDSKLAAKYRPWASCTFEKNLNEGPEKFLRESGYYEFPILCGRWDTTGEDAYATECPGMTALSDIKMLQHGEKRALQALDKSVTPPLVGPTALQNSPVTQLPGGINYDDAPNKNGLRPLHEVDPRLDKIEGKQAQVRERIREAFFADLFRMNSYLDDRSSKQPVTAAEIGERREEKLLQLGPMLHNLDDDVYNPAIDRTFAIMLRQGLIPPAPPELEGQDIKVEYISIMHQAQKAAGLGQLERFSMFVNQLVTATEDPSVMDKVDTDEMVESYAEMAGVAPQNVRSDEDVAAIRADRAKAQQAAQQAATLKDEAAAARDLSQADMSGDNALTAALAGMSQAAGGGV